MSLLGKRAVVKHSPQWPEGKGVFYRELKCLEVKSVRTDHPKLKMDVIMKRVHRCKMGENVQTMANPLITLSSTHVVWKLKIWWLLKD